MSFKLEKSEEIENILNENEFDVLEYGERNSRYKIWLTENEIVNKRNILKELLKKSYDYFK